VCWWRGVRWLVMCRMTVPRRRSTESGVCVCVGGEESHRGPFNVPSMCERDINVRNTSMCERDMNVRGTSKVCKLLCERHIKSMQALALPQGDILRPVAFPLWNVVHNKPSLLMFLSL